VGVIFSARLNVKLHTTATVALLHTDCSQRDQIGPDLDILVTFLRNGQICLNGEEVSSPKMTTFWANFCLGNYFSFSNK